MSLGFILSLGFGTWDFADAWQLTPELAAEIAAKEKAVATKPYYPHPHFDLAVTYAYTNRIEEAWAELKKIPELDPDFKQAALRMYKKNAARDSRDWKLRFRLAFVLYFNDKKKEAIREFEGVLKIDPRNIWAMGLMATIYGDMGEPEKGIQYVKQALAVDADVAVLHYLLAQGYYKQGKNIEGFRETAEALRLKALGK